MCLSIFFCLYYEYLISLMKFSQWFNHESLSARISCADIISNKPDFDKQFQVSWCDTSIWSKAIHFVDFIVIIIDSNRSSNLRFFLPSHFFLFHFVRAKKMNIECFRTVRLHTNWQAQSEQPPRVHRLWLWRIWNDNEHEWNSCWAFSRTTNILIYLMMRESGTKLKCFHLA